MDPISGWGDLAHDLGDTESTPMLFLPLFRRRPLSLLSENIPRWGYMRPTYTLDQVSALATNEAVTTK
jgi:hypothetical protein